MSTSTIYTRLQESCSTLAKKIIFFNQKLKILQRLPLNRGSVYNYESKIRTAPFNLKNYNNALKGIEHLETAVKFNIQPQNKFDLKRFQNGFLALALQYKTALKLLKELSLVHQPTLAAAAVPVVVTAPVAVAAPTAAAAAPPGLLLLDLGDKVAVKKFDGHLAEPHHSPHAFIISVNPPNTVVDKNGQSIQLVTYNMTMLVPIVFDGALRVRGEEVRMVYPIFLQKY